MSKLDPELRERERERERQNRHCCANGVAGKFFG